MWALVVDRAGTPLGFALAPGNAHDLIPTREALDSLLLPSAASGTFAADGAFDTTAMRAYVDRLGYVADIPENPRRTGKPKHKGFVKGRWVVERTHAQLRKFRGLRTRWARLADSYEAFLAFACAHITAKQIRF